MERFFILDKFNTYYDWDLILTAKDITPSEPKTNYIELDGADGSLDLTESLTGKVTYRDRTITATFWTDTGTRQDRERLFREITTAIHGRKIKIIEPDDPTHYFIGRVKIKDHTNILPYMEFSIEATCDPWRYSIEDSKRTVSVSSSTNTDIVIYNNGVKVLCPTITVTGTVRITYNYAYIDLTAGTYKLSQIELRHGATVIGVSGSGSVTFTYKEADI